MFHADGRTDRDADRRTDGQTDMTNLIVALRNYSTSPTKVEQYFMTTL